MADYRDPEVQAEILWSGERNRIIHWLCWNDANGCYTDADSKAEGLRPLTLLEATALMRHNLDEFWSDNHG